MLAIVCSPWRALPHPCSAARALLALLALLASATEPARAQAPADGWRVSSANLEAEVLESGAADVTVRYVLRTDAAGPRDDHSPLVVELLGFGEATADRFTVDGGGEVLLWPTVGSHRAAALRVVEGIENGQVALSFRYRIEGAVREADGALRATMPVLVAPGAPEDGDAGFTARLVLPDGWIPTEGFPSGLRPAPDGTFTVALPVVPSMVGFRGRTDGRRRLGLPRVIDFLTLVILFAFAAAGWRHLSGVARAAREAAP